VFVVVALILGGDAMNGKAEGGKFFLANHGKLPKSAAKRLSTAGIMSLASLSLIQSRSWPLGKPKPQEDDRRHIVGGVISLRAPTRLQARPTPNSQ
jgi:hypothetical protein